MEEKKDYTGGTINAIIIIGFILAIIFQRFDLFVWVLSITFMLYIFAKSLLNRIGNSVSDKVTQRRRELSSGGGVNPRPIIPKPDVVPVSVNTQQTNTQNVPVVVDQTAPVISDDTRKNTLTVVSRLPEHIEFPKITNLDIPILYDGRKWHYVKIGKDGHWGIFGTTGSGKGNMLQEIALAALSAGPELVHLTILDGKGGLDYAFALDINHAVLYDGEDLDAGCIAVTEEMRRRNAILKEARCRNIGEYNHKFPNSRLPLQVVIADELINFSKKGREELEKFACLSRAMGGVLFVATQYPTVDVLPSQVQANVTNRIVARLVSSEYTGVALRRVKADNGTYEPSVIPRNMPGVAVLRQDSGNEILGRAPELTESILGNWINDLVSKYPKIDTGPQNGAQRATGVLYDDGRRLHAPLSEDEQDLITAWVEEYQDQGIRAPRRELTRRLYRHRGGKDPKFKGEGHIYTVVQKFLDDNGW